MEANAQQLEAKTFHQAPEMTKKHGDICSQPPFSFTPLMLWEQADTC